MKLRHAKTKSPIIGTSELVPGVALVDSFAMDDKGVVGVCDYTGETRLDWDNQHTETSKNGFLMLVCEDGELCTQVACEEYEEEVCESEN